MNYAIILAGGLGTRFSSKLPKQFHIIDEKPIFIHTLEKFAELEEISAIVVVSHKDYVDYSRTYIDKYFDNKNIYVTEGGDTRTDSVNNGCYYLKNNFDIKKEDIVLIHEAVRPFINTRIIQENIEMLKKYDGVSTVFPVQESMMEVEDGKIISVPDRTRIYIGQAPQSFKLLEFIDSNERLTEEQKNKLTECTHVYRFLDKEVGIVIGEKHNIKITTPYDLKLSEFIMGLKP